MRLSDKDIIAALNAGKIGIEPRPDDSVITGVSVDLRLGNSFRVFKDHARPFVDVSASREEINSTLEAIMSFIILKLLERLVLIYVVKKHPYLKV